MCRRTSSWSCCFEIVRFLIHGGLLQIVYCCGYQPPSSESRNLYPIVGPFCWRLFAIFLVSGEKVVKGVSDLFFFFFRAF